MQRNPITRKSGVGNLFVKNLHYSIGSARLQSIFCRFGTVLSCKVAEEGGRNKGFGFVQFEAEESAKAALDALNETTIEGKNMYVLFFSLCFCLVNFPFVQSLIILSLKL